MRLELGPGDHLVGADINLDLIGECLDAFGDGLDSSVESFFTKINLVGIINRDRRVGNTIPSVVLFLEGLESSLLVKLVSDPFIDFEVPEIRISSFRGESSINNFLELIHSISKLLQVGGKNPGVGLGIALGDDAVHDSDKEVQGTPLVELLGRNLDRISHDEMRVVDVDTVEGLYLINTVIEVTEIIIIAGKDTSPTNILFRCLGVSF